MEFFCYPPRPKSGGPLPIAAKKFGRQLYSPKYNGWRALIHTPSSTVFNRHGKLLTIASEFKEVLEWLRKSQFEWLDCEGLERRHQVAQGSLIVLDAPIKGNAQERFEELSKEIPIHNYLEAPPNNSLLLAPQMELQITSALELWIELQTLNASVFGCEFYEGVITKQLDSIYPIQGRNPDAECATWTKHRWSW